jgi:hypothetical protein
MTQSNRSLFGLAGGQPFSSEKELLACVCRKRGDHATMQR